MEDTKDDSMNDYVDEDHGAGVANHGGELRLTCIAKVGHPKNTLRLGEMMVWPSSSYDRNLK